MLGKSYNFGDWQLDGNTRQLVAKDGRREDFEMESDHPVLELLIERRGQSVGKQHILDVVWGKDTHVEENNAEKAVSRIRKKLDALGFNGKAIIETVPKSGYRFTLEIVASQVGVTSEDSKSSKKLFESRVVRVVLCGIILAIAACSYPLYRAWNRSMQEQKLTSRNLPGGLYTAQGVLDGMYFPQHTVNDFSWLENDHLQQLSIGFDGSSLTGLSGAQALSSLLLGLRNARITNLVEIAKLKNLKSLTIDLTASPVKSLAGLEHLTGLTSLTIYLGSDIQSLAGLEKLDGLTSLLLDFGESSNIRSLKEVGRLKRLTSLTLNLGGSQVANLSELTQLAALTSFSLDMGEAGNYSIADLGNLKELTSLSLILGANTKSLAGIDKLPKLSSLSLTPHFADIADLTELARAERITSLSLDLSRSHVQSLAGLERLKRLTSLSLALDLSFIPDYRGLEKLDQLTSLTLNLNGTVSTSPRLADLSFLKQLKHLTSLTLALANSRIDSLAQIPEIPGLTSLWIDLVPLKPTVGDEWLPYGVMSLAGLERFTGLNSLILNLERSNVKSLAGLEQLEKLTSLTLNVRSTQIKNLAGLENLKNLKTLQLAVDRSLVTDLGVLERFPLLESQKLWIPASLAESLDRLRIRRGITYLWIIVGSDSVPPLSPGYKFVSLSDS